MERVGEPVGDGFDEAVAGDRDGAGDAAEPFEDPGELDRVGCVGRHHALQRLGVGRAGAAHAVDPDLPDRDDVGVDGVDDPPGSVPAR